MMLCGVFHISYGKKLIRLRRLERVVSHIGTENSPDSLMEAAVQKHWQWTKV